MSKSNWKGVFVDNKILKVKALNKKILGYKIFSRNSTILTNFIGMDVFVHNGLNFKRLKIKSNMVGHKFGEFSWTRKFPEHKKKKKKKK